MKIAEPLSSKHKLPPPLLQIGFRPFFLLAGLFSLITIGLWISFYRFGYSLPVQRLSPLHWHAHEMIYGYSMAVIIGFLLTAVRNWTGLPTLHNGKLLGLCLLWLGARICFALGDAWLPYAALFDASLNLGAIVAVATPIIRAKQWRQLAILSKLILLGVFNALFYLHNLGYYSPDIGQGGSVIGIYAGLYLVISLILAIGRRIVPFFIERGVGYPVQLKQHKLLDIGSLLLVTGFVIVDIFLQRPALAACLAAGAGVVNLLRLYNWHTPGIWRKPLLWGLYLSLCFISFGFLLLAASHFWGISRYIALHALAFGGIGGITLSMMCRVSLGHTGRNIHQPGLLPSTALVILFIGAALRVIAPLLMPGQYLLFITLSALCWILAFALFVGAYFPILTRPRLDKLPG